MKQTIYNFCIAVVMSGCVAQVSQADTYTWNNPAGGFFDVPSNWDPSGPVPGPPMGQDEARFLLPASYVVTFDSTVVNNSLNVTDGNVIFNLMFNSYNVMNAVLAEGSPALSSLTVDNGALNVAGQFDVFSGATLAVNNGVLNVTGQFDLFSGATVLGNQSGVVNTSLSLDVANGAAIRGNLNVSTSEGLHNRGLIAPGELPGTGSEIGSININGNGNFQHFSDGSLEIQISGGLPTATNDVLNYGGFGGVTLGGGLRVPFINSYAPQPNDSFTFFNTTGPGTTIVGRFNSLSVPGLNSGLAARVDYAPMTTSITFVAPVTVGFNSDNLLPPPGPNHFGDEDFWGGGQVPDSTSVVNVRNLEDGERVIELNPNVTGSRDAFVHQITLSGQNHEMALRLPTGTNFTAVDQLTLSNRGVLQLDGGTAHSGLVKVNPGGQIVGSGVIDGDVRLGTTTGTLQAKLSPGFSSGEITIEENLTVAQNGVVEIEIFADDDFDMVIVGEDANLGGTLMVDMTGVLPASIIGNEFVILTAGDVNQQFNNIDTIGAPDYFFQPEYSESEVSLLLYGDGDMNCDGDYTLDDVEKFAMALTNPIGYFGAFEIFGEDSGDMNDDGFFDFDDIEEFSLIDFGEGLTADEVVSYLLEFTAPPVPEPSAALLFVAGSALLTGTAARGLRSRSSILK